MTSPKSRQQIVNLLTTRQAHMGFEGAVENFPAAHINTRPPNVPYTFWQLLEHLRIGQADILDYCVNPAYVYLKWPDDYWPSTNAMTNAAGWQATIDAFLANRAALAAIALDETNDLDAQLPAWRSGPHAAARNPARCRPQRLSRR